MPIAQPHEPGHVEARLEKPTFRVVDAFGVCLPLSREEGVKPDDDSLPVAMRDHKFSDEGLEALQAAAKAMSSIVDRLKTNPCRVIDL